MTDDALTAFLAQYPPDVRDLALQARVLILDVQPGAVEMIDPPSKIIAYGLGRKYADLVCAIQPYKSYLNLVFSKGAALPDPAGILTGTGKRARHARIQSTTDLESPALRALIETAFQWQATGA